METPAIITITAMTDKTIIRVFELESELELELEVRILLSSNSNVGRPNVEHYTTIDRHSTP